MLILIASGKVLLEKRPPAGIWGGLWSLPEASVGMDAMTLAKTRYGVAIGNATECAKLEHGFTHYSLTIHPVEIAVSKRLSLAMEPGVVWLDFADALQAALPAPVKKLLTAAANRSPANAASAS